MGTTENSARLFLLALLGLGTRDLLRGEDGIAITYEEDGTEVWNLDGPPVDQIIHEEPLIIVDANAKIDLSLDHGDYHYDGMAVVKGMKLYQRKPKVAYIAVERTHPPQAGKLEVERVRQRLQRQDDRHPRRQHQAYPGRT